MASQRPARTATSVRSSLASREARGLVRLADEGADHADAGDLLAQHPVDLVDALLHQPEARAPSGVTMKPTETNSAGTHDRQQPGQPDVLAHRHEHAADHHDRRGDHQRARPSARASAPAARRWCSRVISDGAPNCCTSRARTSRPGGRSRRARRGRSPSRCARRTRPRRPSRAICTQRDGEHHRAGAHDVAGVADDDAVVDDVGVEAGQVERRPRCRRTGAATISGERAAGTARGRCAAAGSASAVLLLGRGAVEDDRDDLVGGEQAAVGDAPGGWPENVSSAQHVHDSLGRDREPVGVGADQLATMSVVGLAAPGGVLARCAWRRCRRARPCPTARISPKISVNRRWSRVVSATIGPGTAGRGVDRASLLDEPAGLEGPRQRRPTSSSLESKTRKIVPSATPGRLGDLAGGDRAAVLAQQREGRLDERLAAVVRRRAWRGGSPATAK